MTELTTLLTQQAAQQKALAAQYADQLGGNTDAAALRQVEAELIQQLEDVRERIKLADRYRVATETAAWLEGQAHRAADAPPADVLAQTGLPIQPVAPIPPPSEPSPDRVVATGPTETMPDASPDAAGRSPFLAPAVAKGPARPAPRPQGPDDTSTVTTENGDV